MQGMISSALAVAVWLKGHKGGMRYFGWSNYVVEPKRSKGVTGTLTMVDAEWAAAAMVVVGWVSNPDRNSSKPPGREIYSVVGKMDRISSSWLVH